MNTGFWAVGGCGELLHPPTAKCHRHWTLTFLHLNVTEDVKNGSLQQNCLQNSTFVVSFQTTSTWSLTPRTRSLTPITRSLTPSTQSLTLARKGNRKDLTERLQWLPSPGLFAKLVEAALSLLKTATNIVAIIHNERATPKSLSKPS